MLLSFFFVVFMPMTLYMHSISWNGKNVMISSVFYSMMNDFLFSNMM
jgi:hypothetical protein